jgi:hypothetical protein
MWNMRKRHFSRSCETAAAEPSVKAVRNTPRSGRSEAESLYGRRSEGYARVSAPGCRFRPLALCFQQVPRPAAAGYSRSNREQSISRSTTVFLAGSRSGNLQQLRSNPPGVTCPHPTRCFSSVALRDAGWARNSGLPQTAEAAPKSGLWPEYVPLLTS